MATFTPEDESGLADANSYNTVVYLTDYLTLRGIDCCDDVQATQEANLVIASDYLTMVYDGKLIGEKLVATQALLFPRVVDEVTIYPSAMQNSVCELAIRSFNNKGVLLADSNKRVISEKVDVIERKYANYGQDETMYDIVYNLMKPYLLDDSASEYYHDTAR